MSDELGFNKFLTFLPDSVQNLFKVQFNCSVTITHLRSEQLCDVPRDFAARLEVHSSKATGFLTLFFPRQTLASMIDHFFDEKFNELNVDHFSCIAEFLNIIYASVRTKVNESGYDFAPSIPTTMGGRLPPIASDRSTQMNYLLCSSDFGNFILELRLGLKNGF